MRVLYRQQPFIAGVATLPCYVDVVHSSNADSLTFFLQFMHSVIASCNIFIDSSSLFSGLAACVLRRVSGVAACIHVRLLVFFFGLAAFVLRCARASGQRPALITHTDRRPIVHATSVALITPHGAGAQASGTAASKDAFM